MPFAQGGRLLGEEDTWRALRADSRRHWSERPGHANEIHAAAADDGGRPGRVDVASIAAVFVRDGRAHPRWRRGTSCPAGSNTKDSLRGKVPGDRDGLIQVFLARLETVEASFLTSEAGTYRAARLRLAAPEA